MRWKVITSSTRCNENKLLSEAKGTLRILRQYSDCPPTSFFRHIKDTSRLILESLDNKKPHEMQSLQIRSKLHLEAVWKVIRFLDVSQSVWMLLLLILDMKMSFVLRDTQRHHPIQIAWIRAAERNPRCYQQSWGWHTEQQCLDSHSEINRLLGRRLSCSPAGKRRHQCTWWLAPVTTATNADRLVMSGHKNPIWDH